MFPWPEHHSLEFSCLCLFSDTYNITNARGKVGKFCLFKLAYKLGEDIVGVFDFTGSTVPCVQVTYYLVDTNPSQNFLSFLINLFFSNQSTNPTPFAFLNLLPLLCVPHSYIEIPTSSLSLSNAVDTDSPSDSHLNISGHLYLPHSNARITDLRNKIITDIILFINETNSTNSHLTSTLNPWFQSHLVWKPHCHIYLNHFFSFLSRYKVRSRLQRNAVSNPKTAFWWPLTANSRRCAFIWVRPTSVCRSPWWSLQASSQTQVISCRLVRCVQCRLSLSMTKCNDS